MNAALIFLLATRVVAAPTIRDVPAFIFPGDAPWTVPAQTMASAMTCPKGYPTSKSPPVLLVHGTFASGVDTWKDTYAPALQYDGYTACWIELRQCWDAM